MRNEGRIRWLPDNAVLELTHDASRPGNIVACPPVRLPPLPSALLAAHAWYEVLAAGAAVSTDHRARLRALLANPMVHNQDQAEGLLDRIEARESTDAA